MNRKTYEFEAVIRKVAGMDGAHVEFSIRKFENTDQSHFCGKPVKTIDGYPSAQPEHVRPLPLELIAETAKWCSETGNRR